MWTLKWPLKCLWNGILVVGEVRTTCSAPSSTYCDFASSGSGSTSALLQGATSSALYTQCLAQCNSGWLHIQILLQRTFGGCACWRQLRKLSHSHLGRRGGSATAKFVQCKRNTRGRTHTSLHVELAQLHVARPPASLHGAFSPRTRHKRAFLREVDWPSWQHSTSPRRAQSRRRDVGGGVARCAAPQLW